MRPRPSRTTGDVSPLWEEWIPHRIGNRLFVDFVNTAFQEAIGHDLLGEWMDLVHFLSLTEALPEADLAELARIGSGRMRAVESAAALAEARRLRTVLKAMTEAIVSGKPIRPEWVEAINRSMAAGEGSLRLRPDGARWRLDTAPSIISPRLALVPIARSAAEFLAADDIRRLRRCASPTCVLYFYDTSRTGRRRWCRMELCGNRAKVTAHLDRRAAGRGRRSRATP